MIRNVSYRLVGFTNVSKLEGERFAHKYSQSTSYTSTLNMIFRAAILSALIAVASAQCSVCGDGMRVPEGSKDEVFAFPGQPTVPCGILEQAGLAGDVPIESCPFLPGLVRLYLCNTTCCALLMFARS